MPAVGTVGLGAMPKTKEWLPSLDLGSSSTSKKPGVAVPQYVTRATAGITGTVASVRETAETAQGKDTCFPGLTLKQRENEPQLTVQVSRVKGGEPQSHV